MIEKAVGNQRILQFEQIASLPGVVHAVTTKPANMAPHRGQHNDQALAWRRELCDGLGLSFDRLVSPEQVHGAELIAVNESDAGCGRDGRATAIKYVDGVMTRCVDLPLICLSADCPLVLAYDPDLHAVGVIHASWRGTVAGAATNLVYQMMIIYGSDPGRLLTAIAPSAGPCCYEVGPEIRRIAATRLTDADACFAERQGSLYLDLWSANRQQLIAAGVSPRNIEISRTCSICDERLWSHRGDGESAGRFAVLVGLTHRP